MTKLCDEAVLNAWCMATGAEASRMTTFFKHFRTAQNATGVMCAAGLAPCFSRMAATAGRATADTSRVLFKDALLAVLQACAGRKAAGQRAAQQCMQL